VAPSDPQQAKCAEIDAAISLWRQGDCVVGNEFFVTRVDPENRLGPVLDDDEKSEIIGEDVKGLIVVSQTCDIVRRCFKRPYIEVSPLVVAEPDEMANIKSGKLPAYAFVPALEEQCLVADLDRTMTLEKAVIAGWKRTPGWTTDGEIRQFAGALARKRARFAFPDDFHSFINRFTRRVKDKHGKTTSEAVALRAISEIRVSANPTWDSDAVELMFWFIRNFDDDSVPSDEWPQHLNAWLALITAQGRYNRVLGQVITLADMSAEEYITSDRLDLDHLSTSTAS
jgi:hypothetical protein